MLRDTPACNSSTNYVYDFGGKNLELFYLPAYSPDFNPDEGVWSHLKSQELKAHQATNKEELIKKTQEALKRMAKRPALIRSFFNRCDIT